MMSDNAMSNGIVLVGYSGHAFVVCDAILSSGFPLAGYLDKENKSLNPFNLSFLGSENDEEVISHIGKSAYFISIGENGIRRKVSNTLFTKLGHPACSVIHSSACVSETSKIASGVFLSAGSIVNALSQIGEGVICNTGSIIEHECILGDFVHVAPGATLCGNVTVGENTFVGANSVVREGINIGKNVIVGAGTVINRDVPDNVKIVGNPYRIVK